MDTAVLSQFESSLSAIGVTCTRTTVDRFQSDLTSLVDEPAIGVPLRIEDLSMEDTTVNREPSSDDLRNAETGVTAAAFGIASYGTVGIESTADGDELVSLFPPQQVAVVPASRIQPSMDDTFAFLSEAFDAGRDSVVFVTGNSATADMGATVEGVHGPAKVHVLIVEGC